MSSTRSSTPSRTRVTEVGPFAKLGKHTIFSPASKVAWDKFNKETTILSVQRQLEELKKKNEEIERLQEQIKQKQMKQAQNEVTRVVRTSTGRRITMTTTEGGAKEERGGARVIHTGPRGGRYMNVHGRKVYLPK